MKKKFLITSSLSVATMVAFGLTSSFGQHLLKQSNRNSIANSTSAVSFLGHTPDGAPSIPGKLYAKAFSESTDNLELIMREDFSNFTAGTENEFDGTDLTESGTVMIPDQYTQLPGWWGIGVYQAGGNCALAYPMRGGVINTPTLDLSGKLTIKIRAKAVNGQATMLFNLLAGSKEAPEPLADVYQFTFDSANGWSEHIYEVENFYKGDDAFMQFNAMTYNMGVVIDYIEIYRDGQYLERPVKTDAHSFTEDSFTASWNSVEGADRYLVSLYEDSLSGDPAISVEESFDGFDIDSPEFPESWDTNFTKSPLATGGTDDSVALRFTDNEDYLILPYNGGRVKEFSFFVKPGAEMDEYSYACIMVYGLIDGYDDWYPVGYLYPAQAGKDGALVNMTDAVAGEYLALKLACFYFDSESDEVLIDDIHYVADEPILRQCIREDVESTQTELRITELNPTLDYHFTVKAAKGEMISEATPLHHAFGVATPIISPASDIDRRGAFTANWTPVAKATSYTVDLFAATAVNDDNDKHSVLEEDFNKVESERTPDQPLLIGDIDYMDLDDFTNTPGWLGSGVVIANGMLGVFGSRSYELDLITPYISLNNNNGDYVVEADVYAQAGETLVIQGFNGVDKYNFEETGLKKISFSLSEGIAKDRLMLYTLNHTTFLVDNFRVIQSVKEGDNILSYVETQQVNAPETSLRFSGLNTQNGGKYAYTVSAIYQKYNASCVSDLSLPSVVDLLVDGIADVRMDDNHAELSLAGLELTVKTAIPADISIYDLTGVSVSSHKAVTQINVTLPCSGIYLIKVGNEVIKVRA